MSNQETSPAAVVVPFGKHKGSTVAELLARDPQYAEWLLGQGWLAERFAELHSAILTRGAGTDDTPEHNAIQARFLDPVFRCASVLAADAATIERLAEQAQHWSTETERRALAAARDRLAGFRWQLREFRDNETVYREPTDEEKPRLDLLMGEVNRLAEEVARPRPMSFRTTVTFERRGVDVVIFGRFVISPDDTHVGEGTPLVSVEIKPSMGDDYPTVMRQMQRLGATVLLLGQYTGTAVPLPALREMFAANQQRLIMVQDAECELPAARALIAGGNSDAP